MRVVSAVCGSVLLAGCFAVADIDRFERRRDFDAHLIGFEDYAGQRIEVRLVRQTDSGGFVVESRAIVEMDLDGDHHLVMPLAISEGGSYSADTFVDANGNGEWEGGEPLWRSSLMDGYKLHLEATDMQSMFMDPPTEAIGTGFEMALRGLSVHEEPSPQYFELLVFDVSDGRPVGYYFLPDIVNQDFDVRIPNVIVDGHDYEVDYYADANRTNCYENPATTNSDHTWRETGTGGSGDPGLRIEFIHHGMFDPIDESFPNVRDCRSPP